MSVCVCVCVRERESVCVRERERVSVCVRERESVCVCAMRSKIKCTVLCYVCYFSRLNIHKTVDEIAHIEIHCKHNALIPNLGKWSSFFV